MFKNFRKCRQFYGIAITEKITKKSVLSLKLLLRYQNFVMPYLHPDLKSLFQFVSGQPQ